MFGKRTDGSDTLQQIMHAKIEAQKPEIGSKSMADIGRGTTTELNPNRNTQRE
jgi:hypothetical protein